MLRQIHRWPGLIAALLIVLLALSGAALSVFPLIERLAAPQAASDLSVADLTARVAAAHPGLEQIRRAPSGRVVAYWFDGGQPGAAVIDPATGQDAGSPDPIAAELWLPYWFWAAVIVGLSGLMVGASLKFALNREG